MREKKLYLGIVLIMCILSFAGCGNRNGDQSVPITTSSDTSVSTVEVSDEKFKSLFTSTNSSFGITTSGSLYSWGSNDEGCLGLNSSESTIPTPTKVPLPEKILDLAPGVFSVALTESGKVYTWGITSFGIEGVGRTYESNPQELIMPEKISKIFNGHGSIGLAQGESGSLYVWGWNLQGELGNGTTEHSMSPQKIELPSNVIDASCYDTHVLALCQNGKIYSWGSNYFGELGDGKEITIQETGELLENNRLKPEEVLLDESIISIAAGRGASYALSKNGDLYAWGSNDVGQLGTGNMDQLYSSTPIKIEIGSKITSISVGAFHAFAITENGDVYGWGYNSREGQSISVLGIDTSDLIVYSPTKITFIEPIKSISTGAAHTFAYSASEKILSWGSNSDSKISKDLPELINSPMEVELLIQ